MIEGNQRDDRTDIPEASWPSEQHTYTHAGVHSHMNGRNAVFSAAISRSSCPLHSFLSAIGTQDITSGVVSNFDSRTQATDSCSYHREHSLSLIEHGDH